MCKLCNIEATRRTSDLYLMYGGIMYGQFPRLLQCKTAYTERSDAKQSGYSNVRAVCSAGRTYSRQESIEMRLLFLRDSCRLSIT